MIAAQTGVPRTYIDISFIMLFPNHLTYILSFPVGNINTRGASAARLVSSKLENIPLLILKLFLHNQGRIQVLGQVPAGSAQVPWVIMKKK